MNKLAHFFRRKSIREWIIVALLLVFGTWEGNRLSSQNIWVTFRSEIYQWVSTAATQKRHPQRTTVVLLDDSDYWSNTPLPDQIGDTAAPMAGRAPTNREYLAALVQKLDAAGAPVIALDFDLRSPLLNSPDFDLYTKEDDALWKALKDACNHGRRMVLAESLAQKREQQGETAISLPSIYDNAGLDPKCVLQGYVQIPTDIRKMPAVMPLETGPPADSFALAVTRQVDYTAYSNIISRKEFAFPYSQFMPATAFLTAGPSQTLLTGREVLAASVKDLQALVATRIVLIGGGWHSLASGQGQQVDIHPSPAGNLPGVLLQANYIEAALDAKLAHAFPEPAAIAIDLAAALMLVFIGMLEIHPALKWTIFAAAMLLILAFSYLFLQTFGLFLDFVFPMLILGAHAAWEHIYEWRHAHHQHSKKQAPKQATRHDAIPTEK